MLPRIPNIFVQAHRHSGSFFACMFVLHVLSDCVPKYRQKRPYSASAGTPPLPTFGLGCRCLRQRAAGLEIQLPHAPGRCSSVVGSWRPPAGGGRVPSMGDAESPGGGAVGERRSAAGGGALAAGAEASAFLRSFAGFVLG